MSLSILLTGATGQVGRELQTRLASLGTVIAPTRAELDLANETSVRSCIRALEPNLVVNAAAYTAVDRAESDEAMAARINSEAPRILAEEMMTLRGALVHYSTDYVFDGSKDTPYEEGDAPHPINVYGATKWAGEHAIAGVGVPHLIIRTSWVYGTHGQNFMRTMLRLARERDELRVVADQIGAPTWSRWLADTTVMMLATLATPTAPARLHKSHGGVVEGAEAGEAGEGVDERSGELWNEGFVERLRRVSGVFHATAGGSTSWHGFASAILAGDPASGEQRVKHLLPVRSAEFGGVARRPANSRLSTGKLRSVFGIEPTSWETQLAAVMGNLSRNEGERLAR